MNFDLDEETLLYVLGIAFTLAALVYFARDVVFGLSITVTAALLFVAFLGFLLAGLQVGHDPLDTVAFAISGLSYVVFLGYLVTRYEPSETAVFLLLAGSAALFVGLGYGLGEREFRPSRRTIVAVLAVLLVASTSLVVVDALGGEVQYDVELNDSTTTFTVEDRDPDGTDLTAGVGTLTVRNPSVFTHPVDIPSTRACLAGVDNATERRVHVDLYPQSYDVPDRLAGGSSRVHVLRASMYREGNQTSDLTVDVEQRSSCDSLPTRSEPTLFLVVE